MKERDSALGRLSVRAVRDEHQARTFADDCRFMIDDSPRWIIPPRAVCFNSSRREFIVLDFGNKLDAPADPHVALALADASTRVRPVEGGAEESRLRPLCQ